MVSSKRKTRRRGRRNKERAQGSSWYCDEFGHEFERDIYKSEKQPPGIIIQTCKNCPRERAVRVPRF